MDGVPFSTCSQDRHSARVSPEFSCSLDIPSISEDLSTTPQSSVIEPDILPKSRNNTLAYRLSCRNLPCSSPAKGISDKILAKKRSIRISQLCFIFQQHQHNLEKKKIQKIATRLKCPYILNGQINPKNPLN